MEVEIGIGKSGRRAYGFDDIAIVPSRRTRDPEDVDITWELDAFKLELAARSLGFFYLAGHGIDSALISDVLGLDGKIKHCYMSEDGRLFRFDDQLRSELQRYLQRRFNVSNDSLRSVLHESLLLPLFPTQKRDRFSNNTLAQHFSYLDKCIRSRFESGKSNKRSGWFENIKNSLAD